MVTKRKHAMGSGGCCVCPKCGTKVEHLRGVPCQESRCPECGAKLLREGSEHDRLFREKQARKQQE